MINLFYVILGSALITVVLWDAFEVIVLPRRVTRRFRLTRFFYRYTWLPWSAVGRRIRSAKRREMYLSLYGPLSLLFLLLVWAVSLIVGFGTLHFGLVSKLHTPDNITSFSTYLYLSGETFFTLGYGDVTPDGYVGRVLAVVESGIGLGLLALVIGYLPVIYQAFSRREVNISMLDARAGSPPSAAELLRRHGHAIEPLHRLLTDWERWSAELLESHLSYPVLCYFRSQHNNQSWLAALTTLLDTCALVMVGIEGAPAEQAQLTFAMARHAVVDLAQIFNTAPRACSYDRLSSADLNYLRQMLGAQAINLSDGLGSDQRLTELRAMYEPYINSLSQYLFMPLPAWVLREGVSDNWKTSAWGRITKASLSRVGRTSRWEDHF